ncbi:MAG: N-acetyl-gamma-glutamyl-phosphate reductase [Clostridiales bacterium]|jgi:N-acetyl-gamma-glutamyl-phosphate reductase|nr:N-acetyl-gamma-glutamyl-phosphate reductase [Clostridiales bacterium]
MIKVGIIGANGYTGAELLRILCNHAGAEVVMVTSRKYEGVMVSDVFGSLINKCALKFEAMDIAKVSQKCDVVFTALPHGVSMKVVPQLIEAGLKVIDLSGDFRYKDYNVYEKWYGLEHVSRELLEKSVYGLCEINREQIKNAQLIGNPGCYTTCSIMALAPMIARGVIKREGIVIDAKSGVTGAGRVEDIAYNFNEVLGNMLSYKAGVHRHVSEIEEQISYAAGADNADSIKLMFAPHLVPMKRGIFATIYADLSDSALQNGLTVDDILEEYRKYYIGSKFVRVYPKGRLPQVHNVVGTNCFDVGVVKDERLGKLVIIACIDNLVKGAAGQAVQNMNLMYNLEESTGLESVGLYV